MNKHIQSIIQNTEDLRQQIINHKVYSVIEDIDDLQIFMQYHIFAVWDFMSLLKSLQIELTCTSVPWFPVGFAETRHLINEIVAGEESDVDSFGVRKSHYELYLDAMIQCGADLSSIEKFVQEVKQSGNVQESLKISHAPIAAQEFVNFTFEIINSKKPHLQSAIFTFGREDLIPGMFFSIVNDMNKVFPDSISIFKYYLERHIEVDGDHHSHLSLQMTANLCGTDHQLWEEAEKATKASLQKRINLWDGVYEEIVYQKTLKN